MYESPNKSDYNPEEKLKDEQFPDDTITVVIKSGGKVFMKGINLEKTQEDTAKTVHGLMSVVLNTVDTHGLKIGGGSRSPKGEA